LLKQKDLEKGLLPEVLELRAELAHRTSDTPALHRCLLKLAVEFPTSEAARDVEERLRQWAPSLHLTKQQRFARAEALGSAGDFAGFEREMQAYQRAPGTPVARVQVQRATAWALYKSRRDYARAASLFDECAKLDASSRAQDSFFAARALARAHQDDVARRRYAAVSTAFPSSGYADQARYLAARSHYIHGAWDAAVRAFDAYLASAPKRAKYKTVARYERAVALLAAGKSERAPKEVAALIQEASQEREVGLLRHLLGVAHWANGEFAPAEAEFRRVIAEQPLSFAALASAARLRAMGITDVPTIDPSPEEPVLPPLTPVLPDKVVTLVSLGLLNDAEQALSDEAGSFSAAYAARGGEALCRAYAEVGTARQRYKHAQVIVRERAVQRAIAPSTEWLWDCLYPRPYAATVDDLETELELPAGLMFGVMRQESAFAPRVRSSAGAIGLMQLMPTTARRLAESAGLPFEPAMLHRPTYNLTLAANYLERVLERFSGNVPLAAAAYNAGPAAVSRWLGHAGNLPLDLFVAHIIYDETRGYVQRVVGNWARYRYVAGGVPAVPQLDLSLPKVATVSEHDY
jgi:soluble lytic murein transglycosylase